MKSHSSEFRVYYEDTDAGGVVYYANYLKFAERARTEMLRAAGINQSELAEANDLYFVVRHAELDIKSPARLDDIVSIKTQIKDMKGAKLSIKQTMCINDKTIADIHVIIVCISSHFTPRRVPEKVREKLLKIFE